ncbi:hypothetical protein [Paracoccus alkanivorans]|uniref:Uncharacterized protein n=1 Tax=Paracoccus alkanivorans TaxID=2116655 RepID=A0A3M0MI42_9RHOB|nr:hypothetical protein [Paracoccus alkanivorans]RMC35370.1 hypothetical protein C9E81_09010 [Paracoccus alkanivorans]
MTDITITKLTRINGGQWSKHGNRLVAMFSANVAGLSMHGCILLESQDGLFKANGPRGVNRKGWQISTHIADRELQRALTEEAVAIYRQACRLPGGRFEAPGGGRQL